MLCSFIRFFLLPRLYNILFLKLETEKSVFFADAAREKQKFAGVLVLSVTCSCTWYTHKTHTHARIKTTCYTLIFMTNISINFHIYCLLFALCFSRRNFFSRNARNEPRFSKWIPRKQMKARNVLRMFLKCALSFHNRQFSNKLVLSIVSRWIEISCSTTKIRDVKNCEKIYKEFPMVTLL